MRGTMFHPLTGHPTGNDAQIFIFSVKLECAVLNPVILQVFFFIIGLFCYQTDELTSAKNETDQRRK